jgi:hypothetical protein
MVLVPADALGATLIVSVADAELPDGTAIGLVLNAEKETPMGAEPVTDSVTGPEKLSCEVPVIVTIPEPPWGIEIVGVALRVKSGVVGVSLPTLFAPVSKNQMFPEGSTTRSCGCVMLPIDHSVNCPLGAPTLGVLVGVATLVETADGGRAAAVTVPVVPQQGDVDGVAATTLPPADGSSSATFPFPA